MRKDGISRWWGPVFDAERITRARRWQGYALRSLFVSRLLLFLSLGYSQSTRNGQITAQQLALVGSSAYSTLTSLQLLAVLLVAPAATAGAICLDKTRGTLAHVFVTDLSDREIVLGKLAARLLPVWGLLACALPVSAMATWLGGIDPMALTGAFLITVGVAFLGCALALMLSVWATKPHEVTSVVFGVWTLWLLAAPIWQMFHGFSARSAIWLERTQPFYLSGAPYTHPGETSLVEPILFCLGCGVIGAIFTTIAVWKVREVGCRSARVQARRVGLIGRAIAWLKGQVRWGKGPKLDADPVFWREWHRNRPSRWLKFVWGGFEVLSGLACVGMIVVELLKPTSMIGDELAGILIGLLVTLGLLLVSAATASVLAEERARGSLDVLISTPVSTRTILRAKWWGSFRRVPWLAFWPVVLGMIYSLAHKPRLIDVALIYCVPVLIVAQGATLVSLGLALATWIKRTGQATAWTVTALVVSVVGWPIVGVFFPLLKEVTSQNQHDTGVVIRQYVLLMGSPLFNVALPVMISTNPEVGTGTGNESAGFLILVVGWTLIYALAAWVLFEATVRTFDRCLGRMPERPGKPRLEPPQMGQPWRTRFKGWGWKIPGAGGRRVGRGASFGPPPR